MAAPFEIWQAERLLRPWPDGPEFDELTTTETEALDALADTPCGSLEALFQKDAYIRLKGD